MNDPAFPATVPSAPAPSPEDAAILSLFHPIVRQWWLAAFARSESLFTPPQRQAVPLISQGDNVLICSPTGSGKTLSAFICILNQLLIMAGRGELDNSIYCLYISPLKSLANDIHRNLERPLSEMQALAGRLWLKEGGGGAGGAGKAMREIRHAIRHGDVSAQDRARMLRTTPHILNTTPESLAILLSSPRFRQKLMTVRWVIVDEIHSLAASKRGVHLSLSLERLEELKKELDPAIDPAAGSFVRIGCSATIEPLDEVAAFLAGDLRPVQVVDCRFSRSLDLRLLSPAPEGLQIDGDELSRRLYELVHHLVKEHSSTLIFTNTRNGAERMLLNLRQRYPECYHSQNSACHHGSMGREARQETERRLKQGRLRVVCTSSSLELGIDMPNIDLVLQIGSPKSVASLLQRFGRGGHSLEGVVRGRIIALDREELPECAVMLQRAGAGEVDRIHIPQNALDALSQHLVGMSLEKDGTQGEVLRVVRRSYCYRSLSQDELLSCLRYLSAAHEGMRERRIYPRIRYNPETGMIAGLGGSSRMIYYTNSGMIADQFSCDVLTGEGRWVGRLDESYLESLEKGDVFSIGGKSFSFCYRRGSKIHAEESSARPNIPTWSGERLPLSFDLAESVLSFNSDLLWVIKTKGGQKALQWLQQQYLMDENSARSLLGLFSQQISYLGEDSVATRSRMVVEICPDREAGRMDCYFHTGYGLRFNEGFSRMVAYLLARQRAGQIYSSTADWGFVLSLPQEAKVNLRAAIGSIRAENSEELLFRAVQNTGLLRSVFRVNASRSFLILKSYKGRRNSAKRQQLGADMLIGYAGRLDDFAVLRESFREVIEDRFEVESMKEVLRRLAAGEIEVVVTESASPSPMAFGLAAMGTAGQRRERMKDLQRQVEERIGQYQAVSS
jgi:ATP-dependent Lhr-like helicase